MLPRRRAAIVGASTAMLAAFALPTAASGAPAAEPSWVEHYGKATGYHDYGYAVAASADAIYVAAGSQSLDSAAFVLLRYAPDGSLEWTAAPGLGRGGAGAPSDVAVLADGGIVITGSTNGSKGARLLTAVLEPDGTTRWTRRIKVPRPTRFGPSIALGPDGTTIAVVGSTGDRMLAATFEPDGTRRWTRRIDLTAGLADEATAVAVNARDAVYLTGPVGDTQSGFTTTKLRPNGKIAWQENQRGAFGSTLGPAFLALDPAGDVVLTGVTESGCGLHAATTWKLDARHGTRDWVQTFPAEPCDLVEPKAFGVRADGSLVVVGSELITSDYQNVVVSYGPDGAEEWVARYGSAGTDVPYGLALDAAGTAYVTGATDMAQESMDALTAAVGRDGSIVWSHRLDTGSSSEPPADITLGPAGDVVLTGYDFRPEPWEDALTVSYLR